MMNGGKDDDIMTALATLLDNERKSMRRRLWKK